MDSRQAREVLSRYRPGDSNSGDALMAEALSMAQHDPQLATWFGKHCAAHTRIPGEPMEFPAPIVPPPFPIKAADDREHIIPLNRLAFLMLAATILVLAIAALAAHFTTPPDNTFADYRSRMARLVQRSYPMKITAGDQAEIREYLRTNAGPYDFTLPRALEQMPAKGGAVLTWHNQPVSLLGLDAGGNTNLFLFLVRRSAFHSLPVPTNTQFIRIGRLMTASWSDGDDIYLLAGPDDVVAIHNYLNAPQ
jgi:hypothetical protein